MDPNQNEVIHEERPPQPELFQSDFIGPVVEVVTQSLENETFKQTDLLDRKMPVDFGQTGCSNPIATIAAFDLFDAIQEYRNDLLIHLLP